MLVNDDFGLSLFAAEVRLHKIDFGLHRCQVLLRATLQDEAFSQFCQIGNAGDVEEDVLGQHRRESRKNLFCRPALALEVDNVRLHEHGAAVTKDRHLVRRKSDIGVFLDFYAERLGGRLQEVSVARRTLRVQLKVLYAAVFEDDELDVLTADVDDAVRIVVKAHRRLRMRDGFHERHISVQRFLQNILRVAGCSHA